MKNRSGQDFDPTWPPRGPSDPISIKLEAILSHVEMLFEGFWTILRPLLEPAYQQPATS